MMNVPGVGLEPTQAFQLTGFSYHLQFSLLLLENRICGLDYTFGLSSLPGI